MKKSTSRIRKGLRWKHGGGRYLAIDCLFENTFDRGSDFRAVSVDNPALLAFFKCSAGHHFEQHAVGMGRIIEHLGTNGLGLAEVS